MAADPPARAGTFAPGQAQRAGCEPAAREVVHRIRGEMLALFARHGAASNQVARTYPYLDSMDPATRRMLEAIKAPLIPRAC